MVNLVPRKFDLLRKKKKNYKRVILGVEDNG